MATTSALADLLALSSSDGVSMAKVALLGAGILAALLLVRLLLAVKAYTRVSAGLSSIPMAPGYNPILGHVIGLVMCALGPPNQRKGAWDLMEDWIKATGGSIVRFRILGTQGVAVSDPEALKRIFQTRQKVYKKELELSYKPFLPILGTGLVTSEGELWQKQRLLIGPALRTDILDDIIGIAKNATDRLCKKLEPHRGTGVAVDVEEEFRLLTLQVIGEAVLSLPPSECDEVFPQLYLPVMQEANRRVLLPFRRFLPTPEWFRFHSRMAQLNRFLIGKCRERRQQRLAGTRKGRTDILDRIMDSIEETGTKWDNALEVQLCYELKTFLLAGHETSAAMLTWSVMELANAPPLMQRVLAEADVAFGAEEAEPPRRAVDAMTFTLSVLKEALRKYSVVPVVTRIIAEDDELCGRKVPAGAMVVCHLQGAHNLYKEPRKFNPDRFMPGGEYEQFDESIRPYMFLPFIQGPRNCLGQHLALLESRVVLALLAKRFRMRLEDPSHAGERHPTVIPVGPVEGLRVFLD